MKPEYIVRSQYPTLEYPVVDIYTFLITSQGFKNPDKLAMVCIQRSMYYTIFYDDNFS